MPDPKPGAGTPAADRAPPPPPPPPATAVQARTLADLRSEAEARTFAVRRPDAPLVFADGNPESGVMIVGEAPGGEEERQGRPFAGPAGQLLDKMLAAIELDRSRVYITNLSLWRPAANRVPNAAEAAELLPFLHRHIALVRPRLMLLVGGTSAKALMKTPSGIMRLRGRWHDIEVEGHSYPALPTFHPAYLLREPAQKRLAWQDLLAFRSRLRTV
nr:uracil-DNA glycosylase [Pacificimonas flava]